MIKLEYQKLAEEIKAKRATHKNILGKQQQHHHHQQLKQHQQQHQLK